MRARDRAHLSMLGLALATMGACALSFPDVGAISGGAGGAGGTAAGGGGGSTGPVGSATSSSNGVGVGGVGGPSGVGGWGGAGGAVGAQVGSSVGSGGSDGVCPAPGAQFQILTVAAGQAHTCAAVAQADTGPVSVVCWGDNTYGQLGVPPATLAQGEQVVQLPGTIRASDGPILLAAGDYFTCVSQYQMVGGVVCWGRNESAQTTQDGSYTPTAPPTASPGGSLIDSAEVIGLAAGGRTGCALAQDGSVLCWGDVPPSGAPPTSAVDVNADAGDATAVGVGAHHVCFLRSGDKDPHCFGDNAHGQCGYDPTTPAFCYEAPGGTCGNGSITSSGPNTVTQIQYMGMSPPVFALGGEHTCIGGANAGTWTCFGADDQGQCTGHGGPGSVVSPSGENTPASALSMKLGAAGATHTCVAEWVLGNPGGELLCWGDDTFQQAPDTLTAVPFSDTLLGLVAGANHNCVWSPKQIACWGHNDRGQVSGVVSADVEFTGATAPCLTQ